MRKKICSIRDLKADAFLRPFVAANIGVATRTFLNAARSDEGFQANPEDFVLYELGEFDEFSGQVIGLDVPKPIGGLLDLDADRVLGSGE